MIKITGAGKPAPRLYAAKLPPLESRDFFESAYSVVSPERREKTDKYRQPMDKLRSLGAGLLLLKSAVDCGIGISDLTVESSDCGKPFLPDFPDFHFNISHSGEYVICCVGSSEVGCDIEEMKTCETDIARRFFLPSEYSYIMSADGDNERTLRFYRIWTAKESFMKLTGLGMKMELSSFELRPDNCGGLGLIQNYDKKTYRLQEFRTVCGYCITVCSELTENFGYTDCDLCEIAEGLRCLKN